MSRSAGASPPSVTSAAEARGEDVGLLSGCNVAAACELEDGAGQGDRVSRPVVRGTRGECGAW